MSLPPPPPDPRGPTTQSPHPPAPTPHEPSPAEWISRLAQQRQQLGTDSAASAQLAALLLSQPPDAPGLSWLDGRFAAIEEDLSQLRQERDSCWRTLEAIHQSLQPASEDTTFPRIRQPVFVVGCGRSGTALLCNLLAEHPGLVRTPGYPDGEDHVGWIEHGRCVISGLGASPDIDQGHTGYCFCPPMDEWDVTPTAVRGMHRHYHRLLPPSREELRILNKNPHLSNKLRYVRQIFPDARFVHIVRDVAPMVSSWIKEMELQRHQLLYWPDSPHACFSVLPRPTDAVARRALARDPRAFPGGGLLRLVDYWTSTNTHMAPQLADSPGQLLTVRYEDLLRAPVETLATVFRFLGLEPLQTLQLKVRASNNEKFLAHLPADTIATINALSQDTRETFGYA